MSDEDPSPSTTDEESGNLVERAEELIGFEHVWSGQLLYTSVELDIIDLLGVEPIPATEIAARLGLHDDNCYIGSCVLSVTSVSLKRVLTDTSH